MDRQLEELKRRVAVDLENRTALKQLDSYLGRTGTEGPIEITLSKTMRTVITEYLKDQQKNIRCYGRPALQEEYSDLYFQLTGEVYIPSDPAYVLTERSVKLAGIICESTTCPHARDCAQHSTAGQFREEGGGTPKLFRSPDENDQSIYCNQQLGENHGMLVEDDRDGSFELYNDRIDRLMYYGEYPDQD